MDPNNLRIGDPVSRSPVGARFDPHNEQGGPRSGVPATKEQAS